MNKKKEPLIGDIIFWTVSMEHPIITDSIQWAVVYNTEEYIRHGTQYEYLFKDSIPTLLSVYLINDCLPVKAGRTIKIPFTEKSHFTIYDPLIHTINQ
jgi:hypothetical protein